MSKTVKTLSIYGLCLLSLFFGNLGEAKIDLCQCAPRQIESVEESSCCSGEPVETGSCCCCDAVVGPVGFAPADVHRERESDCGCSLTIDLGADCPVVVVSSTNHINTFKNSGAQTFSAAPRLCTDSFFRRPHSNLKQNPPPITLEICVLTTCLLI